MEWIESLGTASKLLVILILAGFASTVFRIVDTLIDSIKDWYYNLKNKLKK